MDKLYVYADFNWLEKPMLVGELVYESIRGGAQERDINLFSQRFITE